MTTTYTVRVIQTGRNGDLDILSRAVASELRSLGLHRSVDIAVTETARIDDAPSLALFFGSEEACTDTGLLEIALREIEDAVVVIPVVPDISNFAHYVPAQLAFANAVEWSNAADLINLVRVILRELGIEDAQRSVFISHRREDGLWAAEQLHDRLSHLGFRPFIDRFSIGPGRDVQSEIANALEDYAFVLILETPQAHTSDWVYDEVDYALVHTMGVSIVSWPNVIEQVPGSAGLPRLQLDETHLRRLAHGQSIFTEMALEQIVAEVESSHARALVRRRRILLKSIEEAAKVAGAIECIPLRGWRMLVRFAGESTMVGTAPRLPNSTDLQDVDEAALLDRADKSVLVHSARQLPLELKNHLTWVAHHREIRLVPENAIGGWW